MDNILGDITEVITFVNHGRYFFSLKGGLQFDNGFELNSTNHNHVHWLSKNELDPLLDKYTENIIFKGI
jgi:hypothetical protein